MTEKYKLTPAQKNEYLRELRKILKYRTELEFMEFLRSLGLHDEDSEFAEAVQLFRALKAGKA